MSARGLFLVGFSCTGKSTVARAAGEALGWPAHDLDDVVAAQCGCSIPEIFAREGEAGFRAREAAALRELAASPPFVVATGGGAPVAEENRRVMAASGWVVALEARPETLHERLRRHRDEDAAGAARPLLDGDDALARLRALKEARQPAYALADWTVHTDRLSPEQVAAEVVRAVRLLELVSRR